MKNLKKIAALYKNHDVLGFFSSIYAYFFPRKANCLSRCQQLVAGKIGLEIGGPSRVFSKNGNLPIYPYAKRLDNCNFSNETIWEGRLIEGANFYYDKKCPPGRQYVSEATNLHSIASGEYDFVLSSHVIEHVANPILALNEWIRVLKNEGVLVLIVPHKDGTFDHRRPVTSIQHLIDDFQLDTKEDDQTHLDEIITLHDLTRDPGAGSAETFKARSKNNFYNRCLHHHVFNTPSAVKLVDYVGLQLLDVEPLLPMHIILIAQKLSAGQVQDNSKFLYDSAEFLSSSPFKSDQDYGLRSKESNN